METLKTIYAKMKESPKYLIDYKTFTTTLSQLKETAQKEAAALEKRLGGAQLESHPLFEKVSREEGEKLLGKLKETWETLEEMEDGDAAKSLVFFLSRNASVLCVLLGDAWLQSALGVLRESCEAAVSGREGGE